MRIGLIGGSGIYEVKGFTLKGKKRVKTPFGNPSDAYTIGSIGDREIVFLPRHGKGHSILPHKINYRANIWGFRELRVERIISISAVGGIKKTLRPGDIVILDQIIDMTRGRGSTFYDDEVVHIDFTEPYCDEMRKAFIRAGKRAGVRVINRGTYVAVEGPRLETAAEIQAFRRLGADVVGMTGMPEASLAREAEICYAGVSVVANYAAGITGKKLTVSEVMEAMKEATEKIKSLLSEVIPLIPEQRQCPCKDALRDARI